MFNFFRRRQTQETDAVVSEDTGRKPYAVAFVDYEHWYISYDRMYRSKPDIRAWRNALSEKFDMGDIIFFGDFSNPSLRSEIPKIREITSYIIETQNASSHFEKDFTDFIMLDHIYQKAVTDESIDAFVIFSGDGHFSSVASFITNRVGKQVGIYAVKGALSSQLKNSATFAVEVSPTQNELDIIAAKSIQRDNRLSKSEEHSQRHRSAHEDDAHRTSQQKSDDGEQIHHGESQRRHKSSKQKSHDTQTAPKKEHTAVEDNRIAPHEKQASQNKPGRENQKDIQKNTLKDKPNEKQQSEQGHKPQKNNAQSDRDTADTGHVSSRRSRRKKAASAGADERNDAVNPTELVSVVSNNDSASKENAEVKTASDISLPIPKLAKLKNTSESEAGDKDEQPENKGENTTDAKAELSISDGCRMILKNLDYLEEQNEKREADEAKKALPTFWGTVEVVARLNRADKKLILKSMQYLLEKGYVTQNSVEIDDKNVKVLSVDWDKSYGLYRRTRIG